MPHLSLPYPIVLSPDAVVGLKVSSPYPATLSVDGNINLSLENATVTVRRSKVVARFWRVHPGVSFYRTLQQKLKGKG
jgi:NAD kinase